jgi:hypothetical protein
MDWFDVKRMPAELNLIEYSMDITYPTSQGYMGWMNGYI